MTAAPMAMPPLGPAQPARRPLFAYLESPPRDSFPTISAFIDCMIAPGLSCYQMCNYSGIDTTTRAELSDFLKSRRARISPASVGLPSRSRRRTPGLRREEVADLAGVGVTWYTWLEQG